MGRDDFNLSICEVKTTVGRMFRRDYDYNCKRGMECEYEPNSTTCKVDPDTGKFFLKENTEEALFKAHLSQHYRPYTIGNATTASFVSYELGDKSIPDKH